jgi:hypothetical protein
MAARGAAEEAPQVVQSLQVLRAQVWLGLTQLGAGQYRDAQQSLAAARTAWRHDRAVVEPTGDDRLDAQLADWLARSKGN